jgi:hypothetical protein
MIHIENHGPLITATDFWDVEWRDFFLSYNAGAFRLLMPIEFLKDQEEMRTGRQIVVSVGTLNGVPDCAEVMFDDGSEEPYALQFTPDNYDVLPEGDFGPECVITIWMPKRKHKVPHKAIERPAYFRRVQELPCLEPWEDEDDD